MGKTVLIVGPGAVGSCLAAYASRQGKEVYILGSSLKSDKRLIHQGILFQKVSGRKFKIRRNIFCARDFKSPLPLSAAFFCVKNSDVFSAAKAASQYLSSDTPVVFFQNGLNHPAIARKFFNSQSIVIGTCYAAAEKTSPEGVIVHHGGKNMVLARNKDNQRAVNKVSSLLSKDGWNVSVENNEEKMLWTKLCLNASINPLGALAKATNGEITSLPELKIIADRIMEESLSVSESCGKKISKKEMGRLFLKACPPNSRQKNSTLQDLEKGRKTEIRQILNPILLQAEKGNVKIPVLKRISRMIFQLEDYVSRGF
jgi:2-dehydropantoate 2-reductase